jgi:hypothetical protein
MPAQARESRCSFQQGRAVRRDQGARTCNRQVRKRYRRKLSHLKLAGYACDGTQASPSPLRTACKSELRFPGILASPTVMDPARTPMHPYGGATLKSRGAGFASRS